MALVDYVSSDEDDNEDDTVLNAPVVAQGNRIATGSLKRKREGLAAASSDLPPLPAKFHDLYASSTRVSTRDDPTLHGGRKRATPHVEGNWPTHLYIECRSHFNRFALQSGLSLIQSRVSDDCRI